MKKAKFVVCLSVLLSMAVGSSAFAAADKAEVLSDKKIKSSEFSLTDNSSSTEGAYRVLQGTTIVRSDMLIKGQVVFDKLTQASKLTGDLIIKLDENVSSEQFASDYGFSISMNTESNLGIYTPKIDADLVKLLESIKKDDRVIRAKLDKSTNKYQIQ